MFKGTQFIQKDETGSKAESTFGH